jgi:hypothetical protein
MAIRTRQVLTMRADAWSRTLAAPGSHNRTQRVAFVTGHRCPSPTPRAAERPTSSKGDVKSAPKQGTTFTIYGPLAEVALTAADATLAAPPRGNGERVAPPASRLAD